MCFPLWFSHDGPTSFKQRPQTLKNALTRGESPHSDELGVHTEIVEVRGFPTGAADAIPRLP